MTGLLRLNVPRASLPITPAIVEMSRLHPDLTVEVTADGGLVDIVAAGFDAGVRLGEMLAQDMVAVRLTAPFEVMLIAAPAYLDAHHAPETIADQAVQAPRE